MKQLRPYQEEAVTKLKESLMRGNRKIILTLATGSGKSIIARNIVEMAAVKNNTVLYCAHRTILIDQMINTFDGLDNVVVETWQSSKGRHHGDIKIIIGDELHYAVNSKMQDVVLAKYPDAIIIGLSATPIMSDGSKIDGWDDIIDIVQLKDLIEMGYASPVKVLAPASIDRSGFKMTAGDYNGKDVAEEVTQNFIVKDVVSQYLKYAKDMRAIFYCVNIDHAEMLSAELIAEGVPSAPYHSKEKRRVEIMEDFKRGDLHALCSVESLTTGVDIPDIYCLVLATPTKSVIKAVQVYGRATRLNPNDPNKTALILDCANVIDDTVHPLQRLSFNKKSSKKAIPCDNCEKPMSLIKTSISDPDSETGVYLVTKTYKCRSCGYNKTVEDENIFECTNCEGCGEIIERGTSETETRIDKGIIELISICPHCGNEKTLRSVKEIDIVLEEKKLIIDMSNVETWEEVESELKKARDKYGKKYHPFWVKRVSPILREEGFTIEEVKSFVSYYTSKGWPIGGIIQAMKKRRDNASNKR